MSIRAVLWSILFSLPLIGLAKDNLHFCKQGSVDNCRQWKAGDISAPISLGHTPEEGREGAAPVKTTKEKHIKESSDCKPEDIQAGTCILTPNNQDETTQKNIN